MYINKAIRDLMKAKNVSLLTMAKALGKERGNEISSRLRSNNLSFNSAVEMLSALAMRWSFRKESRESAELTRL